MEGRTERLGADVLPRRLPPYLSSENEDRVVLPAWLVDTETLRLVSSHDLLNDWHRSGDYNYAILSHRWRPAGEEVTFQDMQDPGVASQIPGHKKIEATCSQACKDSLKYAWIDTCCIDKKNNTELTEASDRH